MLKVMNETRSPLATPELDERIRQAVGPGREFAVGELGLAVDDADLVAEEHRRAVAELEDGQRDEHLGPPCTARAAGGPAGRDRLQPCRHDSRSRRPGQGAAPSRCLLLSPPSEATVAVDEDPARPQQAALLAVDLATNARRGRRMRGTKLW